MKTHLQKIILFVSSSILFALTLSSFFIFKPFSYIDQNRSQIICDDNQAFDTGPNYIFAIGQNLDSFNDANTRKLCAYGMIRDYENTLPTPKEKNYSLNLYQATESSWLTALFFSSLQLIIAISILKNFNKLNFLFLIPVIFAAALLYLVVFNPLQKRIFCSKVSTRQIMGYRNSAYKNGVFRSSIEDKNLGKNAETIYKNCLNQ